MSMATKLGRYFSGGSSRATSGASLTRVRGLHSEAAKNHSSYIGTQKQMKLSIKLLNVAGVCALLALPYAIFSLLDYTGPRTKTRELERLFWSTREESEKLGELLKSKGVDLSKLDLGRS